MSSRARKGAQKVDDVADKDHIRRQTLKELDRHTGRCGQVQRELEEENTDDR